MLGGLTASPLAKPLMALLPEIAPAHLPKHYSEDAFDIMYSQVDTAMVFHPKYYFKIINIESPGTDGDMVLQVFRDDKKFYEEQVAREVFTA